MLGDVGFSRNLRRNSRTFFCCACGSRERPRACRPRRRRGMCWPMRSTEPSTSHDRHALGHPHQPAVRTTELGWPRSQRSADAASRTTPGRRRAADSTGAAAAAGRTGPSRARPRSARAGRWRRRSPASWRRSWRAGSRRVLARAGRRQRKATWCRSLRQEPLGLSSGWRPHPAGAVERRTSGPDPPSRVRLTPRRRFRPACDATCRSEQPVGARTRRAAPRWHAGRDPRPHVGRTREAGSPPA